MARTSNKKPGAAEKKKKSLPPKAALPVTLLSGFLGSGKTSLLQHVLKTEHGLKIAVIVNDIGAINVDASLINKTHRLTQTQEKVIALQNGCICCTLRGDLLEELVRLSKLQQFDYVIVESSGISEPEQVAETFDARLADTMAMIADGPDGLDPGVKKALKAIKDAGGLDRFAKLDTTVTVIDAFTLFHDFDTDDMLSNRRDDVMPEDERTVSDLMVDQIEFADVIVLNKVDMVDADTRVRILQLIKRLNHRAKIIETNYGKIDVRQILNTGMFNLERAQTGYGWLQDLHAMTIRQVNGKNVMTPKPETEEYDVQNFVYTRRRPFHPRRLYMLMYDKFILQLEHPDDEEEGDEDDDEDEDMSVDEDDGKDEKENADGDKDEDAEMNDAEDGDDDEPPVNDAPPENSVILANKRASPLFRRLFRSKGEFFLATRPQQAGEWSQAGAMLTMTGGRPWFCTLPAEEYITGDAEVDRLVQYDLATGGEWGDRRQEIVFIGESLDAAALGSALDACLLNDEEYAQWETLMRDEAGRFKGKTDAEADAARIEALQNLFEDGFPDWPAPNEVLEMEHAGHNHK
ncbi:Cobalamin (vitamin B12) biosynthesis CobW-like protein [Niveomyces insectorum RCEF 264]|uniref:Cobalamin (Vitamin B12) biosynthesis CobW-like protein n=1 Tax=Niveomyces insectorum RCEF 264 TaxID=1081102 RepID=A0A162MTH0_9HYPO|nr:Cobalamin (vitamin B12) biosynthesis CobW-like protein [Niveomyces insectorum RCEF 264]